jgi:diguanylate cyclase (GGDEF)-like protein
MGQSRRLFRSKAAGVSAGFFRKTKIKLNGAILVASSILLFISAGMLSYLLTDPSAIIKAHLTLYQLASLSWISFVGGIFVVLSTISLHASIKSIDLSLSGLSESGNIERRLKPGEFPMLEDHVTEINALIEQINMRGEKIEEMSAIIDQREQENQVLWLEIEHNLCLAKEEAETDGLTKLYNRKSAEIRFSEEFEKASINNNPLSVLMCDLDHFKNVNDTFGHEVGDEVLRLFADVLREATRSDDMAARYGGEEFIVLLHGAPGHIGEQVAQRINKSFEKAVKEKFSSEYPNMICTVSLGIADYPSCTTVKEKLISMADTALYQAKEEGRNRAVYYNDIDISMRKEAI